jgi:hypothetical protein
MIPAQSSEAKTSLRTAMGTLRTFWQNFWNGTYTGKRVKLVRTFVKKHTTDSDVYAPVYLGHAEGLLSKPPRITVNFKKDFVPNDTDIINEMDPILLPARAPKVFEITREIDEIIHLNRERMVVLSIAFALWYFRNAIYDKTTAAFARLSNWLYVTAANINDATEESSAIARGDATIEQMLS